MKYLNKQCISLAFLSILVILQNSYANYDPRGEARFSLGIESGVSSDKVLMNYKDDTEILIDGLNHTSLVEKSWNGMYVWKNKVRLNVPLFKIGTGNLILQGSGAYGDNMSGNYKITERFDPVDKEAAGYEYKYNRYEFGDIDYKSYDFSVNLAYQIPITPDGRKNRDYYIFTRKVHSFLLPKIGYSNFTQDHSISGFYDLGSMQNYSDNYRSSWNGPFIGFENVNYIAENHKVSFGGNLYYINYELGADAQSGEAFAKSVGITDDSYDAFTLRTKNSMQGNATGSGYSLDARYSYQPGNHVAYGVNANYSSTRIKGGDSIYHYKDGSTREDSINEASWDSFFLSLGITYNF